MASSSSSSSSYLGLTRRLLLTRRRPTSFCAAAAAASAATPLPQHRAVLIAVANAHHGTGAQTAYRREMQRMQQQMEKQMGVNITEVQKQGMREVGDAGLRNLLPGTFIAYPLSEWPRQPSQFLRYLLRRIMTAGGHFFVLASVKLQSMPSWRTRPRLQVHRSQIVPTAVATYRELLEAFAAGDSARVQKLAQPVFANKLVSAIDRRSTKEETRFELIKQPDGPLRLRLFYPKLMSYQIVTEWPYDKQSIIEQAVVAIASTQKMSRWDRRTGEMVAGSQKVQSKIEYVVMARSRDKSTLAVNKPWQIWGTTSPTSLKDFEMEKYAYEKHLAHHWGWKNKPNKS